MFQSMRIPHPVPYQGSKRRLAPRILATVAGRRFQRLYEPLAGSAALTIAASGARVAESYVIADSLAPLTSLWARIVDEPAAVADEYERLWSAQLCDSRAHFLRVRDEFNQDGDAVKLLYLLARCVKNSPRWNHDGQFNQSADHRRKGMNPRKMRHEIEGASELLSGRTSVLCGDFADILTGANAEDLVYLDPPWEGTSTGVDKRYHAWLSRERLVEVLSDLNERGIPWLLSYDGRHGEKAYGPPLPDGLGAVRLELNAGRSSQATLNGETAITVESLYVSEELASGARLQEQQPLFEAA